jgi:hypothetical protein
MTLLDERRETVKELFQKLGIAYEDTNAELVLQVLKRQVVETTPEGRLVPQPRWIKYGSRVLIAIIEQSEADRRLILDAIFGSPQGLGGKARDAYNFVYDVPESLEVT